MLTNLGQFANVGFLSVVADSSRRQLPTAFRWWIPDRVMLKNLCKNEGRYEMSRNALHFCFSYSRSLVPPSKEGG